MGSEKSPVWARAQKDEEVGKAKKLSSLRI